MPDGSQKTVTVPKEKGIDIRIALDMVKFARERRYDVGLIFSQDQDLNEVVNEIKEISMILKSNIILASAFPEFGKNIGIKGTKWIKITKELYDKCLDLRDYRR